MKRLKIPTMALMSWSPTTLLATVLLLLVPSLVLAQDKSGAEVDDTRLELEFDFQADIKPILSDRCFKCHGPDEENRSADLRLDTREGAFKSLGGAYAIIKPGDLNKSELHFRITTDDPDLVMPPPDSKLELSKDEIEKIETWIKQGAAWDEHWFFQPLKQHEPPTPSQELLSQVEQEDTRQAWTSHPIDRFVLKRMVEHDLAPSQPAARERLIRRVTFDLTGLPPTLEEIDSFVNDSSPDVYEKLVDELLSRPAHAERLTNDWLDIARYSDSYGYQVDRDRYVWPWRDWVLRAFQSNQHYDEFLTEQIAGDLLPNPSRDQILATTFCRLHPQKVEGGSVPEEFRNEYVADRMQTVATAFLGLTMECARCHDHKYDPISQREYYSFYAYFNNIDEAGLYSYFTSSIPTPTLLLPNEAQSKAIANARKVVDEQRREEKAATEAANERFAKWWDETRRAPEKLVRAEPIKSLPFEDSVAAPNTHVEGVSGKAVQLTGDDGIGAGVGNFGRHQPFSISLWLKVPDKKERSVVLHRSRAWTDAGSRGYELLLEDGRLKWSLIHFLPGNAISIKAANELPLDQWQHVVISYDGSSQASGLAIWINGQRSDAQVVRDHLYKEITGGGGDNITIGERFRDRGFKGGVVDEFQCFDRELTTLEIESLASQVDFPSWLAASLSSPNSDLNAAQDEAENEVEQAKMLPSLEQLPNEKRNELFEFFVTRVDGESIAARDKRIQAVAELNKLEHQVAEIMVMRELDDRRTTHLLKRGAYDALGAEVDPITPAALPAFASTMPQNRLGLAKWLTNEASAQTARVAVNHYWQMMFGQGIVRTPEDFGSQGKPPTHPELLDWLASDFINHDWDVRYLLKQMVMSQTYRQDSMLDPEKRKKDPENQWLSRTSRYRWPAEMVRDNQLAISGLLVEKVGGPPTKPTELAESFKPLTADTGEGRFRRSLYTYWKRTGPAPVMMALDASKRDVCVVKRERTQTPLQSLVLLNDPLTIECARELAKRTIETSDNDTARIESLFRLLTSRSPDEKEVAIVVGMVAEQLAHFESKQAEARKFLGIAEDQSVSEQELVEKAAWTLVVSTLMNLDECVMKY